MSDRPESEEPPPFPVGWRALYALVLIVLLLVIVLSGWITARFS